MRSAHRDKGKIAYIDTALLKHKSECRAGVAREKVDYIFGDPFAAYLCLYLPKTVSVRLVILFFGIARNTDTRYPYGVFLLRAAVTNDR